MNKRKKPSSYDLEATETSFLGLAPSSSSIANTDSKPSLSTTSTSAPTLSNSQTHNANRGSNVALFFVFLFASLGSLLVVFSTFPSLPEY